MQAFFFNFCLLSLCSVVAAEKTLYLVSNKNEVPGFNTFFGIEDPDTDKAPKANDLSHNQIDANNNYLSQACVCDGTYYSIWTNVGAYDWGISGIKNFQKANATNTGLDVFELGRTNYLFHSLACGQNKNELIGIGNIPEVNVSFNLISLDISDPENPVENVLFDGFDNYPQGGLWDTTYSYIPDLNEEWTIVSTLYKGNLVGNKLYRVPVTKDAEPKVYKIDFSSVPSFKGQPVFAYFATNMGSKNGGVMAILNNDERQNFYLTNFEFDDDSMSITFNKGGLVQNNDLNTRGVSIPVDSDGKMYFVNDVSQSIIAVDGKSENFDVVNEFTFTKSGLPYKMVGGLVVL